MNMQTGIAVAIALIVIVLFFVFGFTGGFSDFGSQQAPVTTQETTDMQSTLGSNIQATVASVDLPRITDLYVKDITVGTGAEATAGSQITVNYVGTLTDGTVFDSSIPRGTPFSFVLGSGQVIQGWERGFAGMKEGGTRVLIIPASLGYGAQAIGPIPANSMLVFEVELLKVGQ
jgi:FKBP-type peptidyl-prolyl cis-trans isomerase